MPRYPSPLRPRVTAPLDEAFLPIVLANRKYIEQTKASNEAVPLVIGVERGEGEVSVLETLVAQSHPEDAGRYVERMVKCLLWMRGGWRVYVGGHVAVGEYVKAAYSPSGARAFDAQFMGGVYGRPFEVVVTDAAGVPEPKEMAVSLGRHLDGCRIGFDLGASDRKVAAVVDGNPVFSEEVEWDPRNHSDPDYHYAEIQSALHRAALHMPRVDAIGGSSAGIYIGNRVKVASLFRAVSKERFESKVSGLFVRLRKDWGGIPFEVVNDGEVTALAGSMSLGRNGVLGIALGSSEAGGYVTADGNITGWLNELAFAPVDVSAAAAADEWSGDVGCGVQYLSQQAVFRLARKAGIELDETLSLAGKLRRVQDLFAAGDSRAMAVMETIGVYLGYAIAHYADVYDIQCVLILGRVTSGGSGAVLLAKAQEVLIAECPELAAHISLHLPDESSRRVGQAVAAASLPSLES